ncbi:hypothetical protein [Burkholderia sp. WSM2232]|uniref:hypothetical protein n=1 Tax=Burkholderia sp. WSM2232 TaxID=944436 RepID=UPI00042545BE|nr:hypothetical protein [Burkholderia sp. WSM2232]
MKTIRPGMNTLIASPLRKLALCVPALLLGANAYGGTDAYVNFVNLSPYQATVSFPNEAKSCWYDTGADADGRIAEYQAYYRSNQVSNDSLTAYMKDFKGAYGIKDFATVPVADMNGTQQTMAPAKSKATASSVAFRGETSASLSDGCKTKTASRGFDVTLTDTTGKVVSKKRYQIDDPSTGAWTLSRMKDADLTAVDQSIKLGSGGQAYPLEFADVAITAGLTYLTILSIGTAGPELWAARMMYTAVFRQAGYSGLRLFGRTTWELGKFVFVGGLRTTAYGRVRAFEPGVFSAKGTQLVTLLLSDGVVGWGRVKIIETGKQPEPQYEETGDPDFAQLGVDLSSPLLMVNRGLPDNRSVCVYETKTLGFFSECRMVGMNLSIMPDGSLDYLPLPPVGSGT